MSYHLRNSSHITNHFLRMSRSLRYMCCIACCWKLRIMPAVRVLEGAAVSCRRLAVHPAFQNIVTDNIHSYIRRSTCGSYRIVSRYFVWYCIVSIVFSKRELKFMFAICHRPSICLLSVVCNVRAPYSGRRNKLIAVTAAYNFTKFGSFQRNLRKNSWRYTYTFCSGNVGQRI